MLYYIKPHNEYVCSISVDSDFDFGNGWSLIGETATHFYMSTDNIDKAYSDAKALGVSITTVNTAWEIDPCLLEYDIMYLDTLSWTVEYWDSLPVEMINAIVATGDTYSFNLYTKAYAYMRNGFDVANNQCDIDWDAPAPELSDDVETLSPEEDMMITLSLQLAGAEMDAECDNAVLIKFSEFYASCVYYHIMKGLHSIDIWSNGDAHEVYASHYTKALLSHYGYDNDEYLVDTSFEKDFSDVVGKLAHDPYDLWVIAHMTSKLVNDYRDELNECLWYAPYKAELIENFNKYVPVPSGSSQYIIACNVEVVEPVRDDVKLPLPVESVEVIVPQEVVSEPQEGLSTTTQINGDDVMNNNTVWLDWSISTPCLKAWELDFGTYVPVVESEPVVEVVKPHYSDKWFGQCCDLNDNPEFTQWDIVRTGKPYFSEVIEFTPLPSKAPSIMNIGRDKVSFSKVLTPEQLAEAEASVARASVKMARCSAYASPVRCGSPVVNTPTITTKSGDIVKVSDEEFAELESMFDKAMAKPKFPFTIVNNNSLQGNQINPDCSRAKAIIGYGQVSEFKSTLFNVDEYDITRNVVVDVATTTPKSTPATPKAPKPSTAKFANNFNSLVMAKYRELNGGIIKDSLVLNKLTSALRANDMEAYNKYVTIFNNPTAVALHRQAYDALTTAS